MTRKHPSKRMAVGKNLHPFSDIEPGSKLKPGRYTLVTFASVSIRDRLLDGPSEEEADELEASCLPFLMDPSGELEFWHIARRVKPFLEQLGDSSMHMLMPEHMMLRRDHSRQLTFAARREPTRLVGAKMQQIVIQHFSDPALPQTISFHKQGSTRPQEVPSARWGLDRFTPVEERPPWSVFLRHNPFLSDWELDLAG